MKKHAARKQTNHQAILRLLNQVNPHTNKTFCTPELGLVQFMILTAVVATTPTATNNSVITHVFNQSGDILDVAQVYVTLQSFLKQDPPLIKTAGTIKTTPGHRRSAAYAITPAGHEALKRTAEHLERVLHFYASTMAKPMPAPKSKPPCKDKKAHKNTSQAAS